MHLDPTASVGDLARAGALGRAVKRVWHRWGDDAIIEDLEEDWPGLARWKYEAVVKLAKQGVAAARLLRGLAAGQTLNQSDIPVIPP